MKIIEKQLSFFEKYYLKYTNRPAYRDYKYFRHFGSLPDPDLTKSDKPDIHFKHSGNAGDIIYAIPTMLALAGKNNIHLHLHIDQPANYEDRYHPLGDVMLNKKMVSMLNPLILSNIQIKSCDVYIDQPVDYDLDVFRTYPIKLDRGNIARWYFLVFAVNYDLNKTWLHAAPNPDVKDSIVIARSHRYLAPGIKYDFIEKYKSVYFIGLGNEYSDMKKMIPSLKHLQVKNFLEMAEAIRGSRLFIGNQSFPFSIAEALKVNRLLELYYNAPNVNVYGDKGYDFCYQAQFEVLVERRFNDGKE